MQKRRGNPGGESCSALLGGAAHQRGAGLRRCLFHRLSVALPVLSEWGDQRWGKPGKGLFSGRAERAVSLWRSRGPTTSIWLRPPILRRVSAKRRCCAGRKFQWCTTPPAMSGRRRCGHWRLVQIYLPDFKYAESGLAGELSAAPDYPETPGPHRGDGAADGSPCL